MDFPSTIITGNNPEIIHQTLIDLAQDIGNEYKQNNPDLYLINQETGWGIEEIRKLKNFASHKPIQYQSKLIVILDAQNLGIESQNALLKLIEEPPPSTYTFLTTTNHNSLLATIRSRCHLIRTKNLAATKMELLTIRPNIQDNLLLSDQLAQNKDEVLPYLLNQLSLYQKQLLTHPNPQTKTIIDKLIKAIKMIKANIDPKTALDWFLLS